MKVLLGVAEAALLEELVLVERSVALLLGVVEEIEAIAAKEVTPPLTRAEAVTLENTLL